MNIYVERLVDVDQGGEDLEEKDQDDKGQEASPAFPDSPTIPAAYPGELAAERSEEASIADPCNAEADATLGITDGGGGFQEVRPRSKRSTGGQRRTGRKSRQPGRVLEVLRPASTTNGPVPATKKRPTGPIRVLTVRRPY